MTAIETASSEAASRTSGPGSRTRSSSCTTRARAASRTSSARSAAAATDNHLGDTAGAAYDRELDQGLEEGAQQTIDEIDAALRADRGRHVRHLRELRRADRRRPAARDPVGAALHRRPAARRVERAAAGPGCAGRLVHRRADASLGRRALARRRCVAVGGARDGRARGGGRRPGDEARRHEHARLDESVHVVGPLSIHHVQNSGIAFGLFAGATAIVTFVTAPRSSGWSCSSPAPAPAIRSCPLRSACSSAEASRTWSTGFGCTT